MLGPSLDFTFFNSYFQTKKTAQKVDHAIFLEPEMLWSLLDPFWKALVKIEQLESSMALSLTPKKLRAV